MKSLFEDLTIKGNWWLGDNPEKKVAGQLYYSAKKATLSLDNALIPLSGTISPVSPIQQYPLIYGKSINGEAITIIGTSRSSTSFSFGSGGGANPEVLLVNTIILGAYLPGDFLFSQISFQIPGLSFWLGRKVIKYTSEESQDGQKESYHLELPKREEFRTHAISATTYLNYGWHSKYNPYLHANLQTSARIGFIPDAPQPISWYLKNQYHLLTMLTFLSGHSLITDSIEGVIEVETKYVDILISLNQFRDEEIKSTNDAFMSREDIGSDFEDYCNKWFDLVEQLANPIGLARSILSTNGLWVHVEFLSLMQALEGLHRALYDGNYTDNSAYETIKDSLIKAIPKDVSPDHRAALKSRIKYGNQISLQKRLNKLVDGLSEKLRKNLFGSSENLPRSWIDTRNYYTHWDEELLNNVLENKSMYYANIKMRQLIRVLYIRLMGIEETDIEAAFAKNSKVVDQIHWINKYESHKTVK